MGAVIRKAWLADGAGGLFPTELPALLSTGDPGLVISRVQANAAAGVGVDLASLRVGPMVAVHVRDHWCDVPTGELAAAAFLAVQPVSVTSVVVCPAGVPPEATALALLVATLLEMRRGRAAVMCGVRAAVLDDRCFAIAWPVLVEGDGGIEVRHVWELVARDDGPGRADASWGGPAGLYGLAARKR